jgi:hypothetical protein
MATWYVVRCDKQQCGCTYNGGTIVACSGGLIPAGAELDSLFFTPCPPTSTSASLARRTRVSGYCSIPVHEGCIFEAFYHTGPVIVTGTDVCCHMIYDCGAATRKTACSGVAIRNIVRLVPAATTRRARARRASKRGRSGPIRCSELAARSTSQERACSRSPHGNTGGTLTGTCFPATHGTSVWQDQHPRQGIAAASRT